ncbi:MULTISPECIES: hypothetical protein [unclassified Kitasatospora]|uniref:hypothetical protein n=1 Tax=unclassified Kitasatospora TaxID=2633591 RepID=UPI0034062D98
MHVVLSTIDPSLENALVDRGQRVLAVIPAAELANRSDSARYGLCAVKDWDDYTRLALLARELEPQGIASVSTGDECCLRAAAVLRAFLGLPGQSLASAVAATDKAVMKRALAAAGVPVADNLRAGTPEDIAAAGDALGWPVVAKHRYGFATLHTHLVRSREHLAELHARRAFGPLAGLPAGFAASAVGRGLDRAPGGILVERAVPVAAEYHCELLRNESRELYCLPGRYPAPLLGTDDGDGMAPAIGSVLMDDSDGEEAARVRELARAAADALGLVTGFAHVEVLRDTTGAWYLGEIGLRPGGNMIPHLLRLQHGIDVAALLADLAQGRPPSIPWRTGRPVAWAAVPAAPGRRITGVPGAEEISGLPHVTDAIAVVRPGTVVDGPLSSLTAAGHVFCTGATPARAAAHAAETAATWARAITTEPTAAG